MPGFSIHHAKKQLSHFLTLFDAVLAGKKPQIDVARLLKTGDRPDIPSEQHTIEQRIVRLLEHMYDNHCLTEQPGTYLAIRIGPDKQSYGFEKSTGGNPICPQRNTRFHPLSSELVKETVLLRHYLAKHHFHAVDIVGRAGLPIANPVAMIVPAVGDLRSAQQLTDALLRALSDHEPRIPIILLGRAAIGFWKPLLASVGDVLIEKLNIDTGDRNHAKSGTYDAVSALNIHAIKDIDDLLELLRKLRVKADASAPVAASPIKPGATILVATKTRDKIYELRKQFEDTNLKLFPLDVIANFKNPKETSGTYAANAKEKIDEGVRALTDVVAKHGLPYFQQLLQSRGIDPETLYLLAEDSGLHLDNEHILEHMDLKTLGMQEGYIFNSKHFPGVEFGPAVNSALGEKHFWDEVNRVHRTIAEDATPLGTVSVSVLALCPIRIDHAAQQLAPEPLQFYSAVSSDVIIEHPRPSVTVPTSSHYQVPIGAHPTWLRGSGMEHLTRAEMKLEEWLDISPRGMAANTLMVASGIKQPDHRIDDAYNPALHPHSSSKYRSAYQIGLFGSHIRDITTLSDRVPCDFHSVTLANLGMDDRWNRSITRTYLHSDVLVILPFPKDDQEHLFDQLFGFFSAIVARQIHPRDIDKPLIVFNKNRCWQPALTLYDHLRNNAMIFDQSRLLLREVTELDALRDILEKSYQHRFSSTHQESPFMPMPIEKSGRYNVAVFCSAGARNDTLNQDAFRLGAFLGEQNCGLVFGAGDREMMGSAYRGMLSNRTETRGWIGASSVSHILEVEADHPERFTQPRSAKNPDGPDQYYNAATIYDRMDYMIRTAHAFAVIPGGAGTIQELAALLLLKKQRHHSMVGKPIFLLNEMEINDQKVAFYQPLIDLIPPAERDALELHVCHSMTEIERHIFACKKWASA